IKIQRMFVEQLLEIWKSTFLVVEFSRPFLWVVCSNLLIRIIALSIRKKVLSVLLITGKCGEILGFT
ncbi:hypothetical protein ABTM62_19210, partial [Acinetobacter baumannii]